MLFQTSAFLAEFLEDVIPTTPAPNTREDVTQPGCCSCEAQQKSGGDCSRPGEVFMSPGNDECSVLRLADPQSPDVFSKDMIGCLLLHHLQQMSCNVHAITSIVTSSSPVDPRNRSRRVGSSQNVSTREQKRIASAIYPTASLLNHACDPDVLVRWVRKQRKQNNVLPLTQCFTFSNSSFSCTGH